MWTGDFGSEVMESDRPKRMQGAERTCLVRQFLLVTSEYMFLWKWRADQYFYVQYSAQGQKKGSLISGVLVIEVSRIILVTQGFKEEFHASGV